MAVLIMALLMYQLVLRRTFAEEGDCIFRRPASKWTISSFTGTTSISLHLPTVIRADFILFDYFGVTPFYDYPHKHADGESLKSNS